jgi:hypothetical protein
MTIGGRSASIEKDLPLARRQVPEALCEGYDFCRSDTVFIRATIAVYLSEIMSSLQPFEAHATSYHFSEK